MNNDLAEVMVAVVVVVVAAVVLVRVGVVEGLVVVVSYVDAEASPPGERGPRIGLPRRGLR